ncbi:MAG TPA: hypothetical protein VMH85_14530 [Terriglobales bacterium]|nr:hypothetical protein [Terriglobales bacterium]
MAEQAARSDAVFYVAGVVLGLCAGWVDVWVSDLLLTALLVMIATMLLGVLRPARPWRWVVLVAALVPVAHLLAYWLWKQPPDRAQVYESFLGFLTGTVGAYAGSVMRRAMAAIFLQK